jgi:hypothetical protein
MNNDYIAMQDLATYISKLAKFNWHFEQSDNHEIWSWNADQLRLLESAAHFSPEHRSAFEKHSK